MAESLRIRTIKHFNIMFIQKLTDETFQNIDLCFSNFFVQIPIKILIYVHHSASLCIFSACVLFILFYSAFVLCMLINTLNLLLCITIMIFLIKFRLMYFLIFIFLINLDKELSYFFLCQISSIKIQLRNVTNELLHEHI